MNIHYDTKSISHSAKIALTNPQQSIDFITGSIAQGLRDTALCNAYMLLSFIYKSIQETKNQMHFIDRAIEVSILAEDRIRALAHRSAAHCDNSQLTLSLCDIYTVEHLIAINNYDNPEIIFGIKIIKFQILRLHKNNLISERYFQEIEKLLPKIKNKNSIANYYKVKGYFYIDRFDFAAAIECFEKCKSIYAELNYIDEIVLLSEKFAYCKFKCNDLSYIKHKEIFHAYLLKKNNLMSTLRYLIALTKAEINPLEFFEITIENYTEATELCIALNDWKSSACLMSYLAKYYQLNKNSAQALFYFNKHVELIVLSNKENEEAQLLEMQIQYELNKQLNRNNSINLYAENFVSSPTIVNDYVTKSISALSLHELQQENYEIMSHLVVKTFKDQVSICTNHGIKFLETNNIQVLESDGNYTILYDKDAKRHISSKPLAYYEKQLDPKVFIRTHRSYIINKNYIAHFFPGRVGKIQLTNGQIIEVSARKMAEVRRKILN